METTDRPVLHQVSLARALLQGDYDGSVSVGQLRRWGDMGVGAFDRLDGELVMLDGEVWRAAPDCALTPVGDGETVCLACAAVFRAERTLRLGPAEDLRALTAALDAATDGGGNRFAAVRIAGVFPRILMRSVPAQTPPYPPFMEIMRGDPRCFEGRDIPGTLMGFRCPAWMDGLNAPGWHLHFLSADCRRGGHVLDAATDGAEAKLAYLSDLAVHLPEGAVFRAMDLSGGRG